MPVYNRADMIGRAIESVLSQSYPHFELVVVDDGSTDDTEKVLGSYTDPRFSYLRQPNAGAAAARNAGVRMAKSEYVTFLDSDDEVTADWLFNFAEGFSRHQADLVCCGYLKKWPGRNGAPPVVHERLPYRGGLFHAQTANFICGTFAMRRSLFEKVGGYAEGLPSGQHTDLALRIVPRILEEGLTIHNVMVPLVHVHAHDGDRVRSNWQAVYEGSRYLLETHHEVYAATPRIMASTCAVAGVAAVRLGRFPEARRLFRDAVRAQPRSAAHWGRLLLSYFPLLARRVWP